ncbi:MAG TPA: methyltransferase type 11 [Anaerolineae bacterium]|nr:methyltransferase type 11 [Anaerolineae bacterium]
MKAEEYDLMYRVEEKHWWYAGMQAITRRMLVNAGLAGRKIKILDAGCGTGGAISGYLAQYGNVTGCDLSAMALGFCQKRNISEIAQASVTDLPFAQEQFELVTSFDVLYERGVGNDQRAVTEFWRVLQDNGYLFLRLPAYDWLRGEHDERIQTARRYTRAQVRKMLVQNGFEIVHLTYANTFLFPIALAKRLFEKIRPARAEKSDLEATHPWLDPFLAKLLASEAPLITRTGLPFGLSVLALARKRR